MSRLSLTVTGSCDCGVCGALTRAALAAHLGLTLDPPAAHADDMALVARFGLPETLAIKARLNEERVPSGAIELPRGVVPPGNVGSADDPAPPAPPTRAPFVNWLFLQPHSERMVGPELLFDRTALRGPTTPRITLQNGERVPMHPLGFVDADTGAVTQWRVPEGDIVSYVCGNEVSHFDVFTRATRGCLPGAPAGSPRLFLDVGANHGLFGLMAGARGCDVEFYDPQRKCADMVAQSIALLPYAARMSVTARPVGEPMELRVAYSEICAGRYEANPGQLDTPWDASQGSTWGQSYTPFEGYTRTPSDVVTVSSVSLDDVIAGRRVAALKVDVESFEAGVLRSGLASFKAQLVDVLVVEVSTQTWTEKGWDMEQQAAPFLALVDYGYRAKILRGREALGDPGNAFAKAGGVLGETDREALRADLTRNVGQRDYMFVAKHVLEADCDPARTAPRDASSPAGDICG